MSCSTDLLSRRSFVGLVGASALGAVALSLSGCGESRATAGSTGGSTAEAESGSASEPPAASSASPSRANGAAAASQPASSNGSGAIVVYFSHAGENYGVGHIDEGNTAIVAKMIAEGAGADLFEVVPAEAYPEGYDECCDVALAEQNEGARPAYEGDVDLSPYQTVFLGYPIWWGDLPMCLYTFLESHDWSGKEVRPFCTHAGSGLSGTVASIETTCSGASVGQGLSIEGATAQNSRDEARSAAEAWLR